MSEAYERRSISWNAVTPEGTTVVSFPPPEPVDGWHLASPNSYLVLHANGSAELREAP